VSSFRRASQFQKDKRMRRQVLLRFAVAAVVFLLLTGHSPYKQWYVYRAKHLIIVASEADPKAFRLADKIAQAIVRQMPESHAVAATAQTPVEIARLLRSHQLPIALLRESDAWAAYKGEGVFKREGPLPLRSLATFPPYVLATLDDFPAQHAPRIAGALADLKSDGDVALSQSSESRSSIPLHPGIGDRNMAPAESPPTTSTH
jgi:hypothetical protein